MVNVEVENGTACYDNLKSFDVCIQGKCQVFHKLLLVCTWRHGGHDRGVLVVRTKAFFSSGNHALFSCKFFEKKFYCIDHQHTSNMAALSLGCKPRKYFFWFILYLQTNDDDENNRKSRKKNWFMSKTTSLHVHLVFSYIPWRHCTTPDATFYGGRLYTTTNFPFSFWSWIKFLRIQLPEKAPTFNKLKGSK